MPAPAELGRRRASCGSVAALLPAVAAGDASLEGAADAHVATCLRCQADLARYRRLRRTLRGLGEPTQDPGPEVLASILASLDAAGLPRRAHVTLLWAVTAGAVGVTVAAGGVMWATRRGHLRFGA